MSPSLPAKQGSAPRPGPEVLYEPLAQAPQLENARGSGWHAAPMRVDCKAQLNVTTDGPLAVMLEDCHGGGRKTVTASFG